MLENKKVKFYFKDPKFKKLTIESPLFRLDKIIKIKKEKV